MTNVGDGVFRHGGHGGGIFDGTISGLGDWGSEEEDIVNQVLKPVSTPAPAPPAPAPKPAPMPSPSIIPSPTVLPMTSMSTTSWFSGDNRVLAFGVGAVAAAAFVYFYAKKKRMI